MKIKKECPDLPFFISENGMGVEGEEKYMDENGTVQDRAVCGDGIKLSKS